MSTESWVAVYVVAVVSCLWLLLWGGARFLEGTFASGCLISWLTPKWSEETIRFFAFIALLAGTALLVPRLFRPEWRRF